MGIPEQILHEGSDEKVVVKNTSAKGSLRLTKTVTGKFADRKEEFTFRITLTYSYEGETLALKNTDSILAKKNGEEIEVLFLDGVCEVTLKNGDELLLSGIYDGVMYEIEEINSGSYRVTVQGNRIGVIHSNMNNGLTEVGFINTKDAVIPTGVDLDMRPVIAGTALLGLGIALLILGNRRRKRRRAEEE